MNGPKNKTQVKAVEVLSAHFESAGIEVKVNSADVLVKCDSFRLKQVITNILTNALKYGNGKPVHVSLAQEGKLAVLKISDQGIGIAPENLTRIFGRFERVPSESNVAGLGLGLFISQHIMEAHGGSIEVTSNLGEGSVFSVTIPVAQ